MKTRGGTRALHKQRPASTPDQLVLALARPVAIRVSDCQNRTQSAKTMSGAAPLPSLQYRSSTVVFDYGKRSSDYAEFRPGFPPSFYDRLERFVRLQGQRVLDVGTGPGVMAREMASRGAHVTGLDISPEQVQAARQVAAAHGLNEQCQFLIGSAERTGLQAGSFDLATAGQCWHWFDAPAAMTELKRVLRENAHLVVAHYSYLAEHCEIAGATEQLILEHNPSWTMANSSGIYPDQIDDLIRGGFRLVEQFCYQCQQPFTHAAWRGRMRTCHGVGSGGMTAQQVQAFDTDLAALLRSRFPTEPLLVEHRVWCVIASNPGQ